ncbi:RNF115.2 family protein [Megaselia abdita]
MAEAVVEGRPTNSARFFCHKCNVEINSVNTDYTCPLCSNGFIEELPPLQPNIPQSSTSSSSDQHDSTRQQDLENLRDEIASLLVSRTGIIPSIPGIPNVSVSSSSGSVAPSSARQAAISSSNSSGSHQPFHRLDNILLEVLNTLSRNDLGGMENSPMFFMGNPGDYAWGREGIDTIVTQLLNQMDTAGPPPLPKDKIDEIPTVQIHESDIENKLQCSVCWEDFVLNENVRKLPCMHCYHNNCIVKWLQLNGTCPICRKSVVPESEPINFLNSESSGREGSSSSQTEVMDHDAIVIENDGENSATIRMPPIDNTNTTRFDDGNVEYDFD